MNRCHKSGAASTFGIRKVGSEGATTFQARVQELCRVYQSVRTQRVRARRSIREEPRQSVSQTQEAQTF